MKQTDGDSYNIDLSIDEHNSDDVYSSIKDVPDAEPMGNLWLDRRQSNLQINFTERRSGIDRRLRVKKQAYNRNGNARKHNRLHFLLLLVGDLVALFLSFAIAFSLANLSDLDKESLTQITTLTDWASLANQVRPKQFLVASMLAVFVFWFNGHYTQRRPFWHELRNITKLILILACIEVSFIFISGRQLPRIWVMGTWLVAIVMVPLVRSLVIRTLMKFGLWSRPTVIVGIGRNAQDIAAVLANELELGLHVAVFLVPPSSWAHTFNKKDIKIPKYITVNGRPIPVRKLGRKPEETLLALGAPHMIIALETVDHWEVSKLLLGKKLPYSSLSIAPSIRGLPLIGMEMLQFFKHDVMLLRIQNNLNRNIPQIVKRAFDLIVALVLLVLLSPLFLFVMVAIRLSGPNVFFGHSRLGKNGRTFKCYKFRTMVPNAQAALEKVLEEDPEARAEWSRDFKLRNDPRVTPIGRFLRKTSLDELPQLWNVIRGEMSLVGPRPIIQEELDRYESKKEFFLEAKPGMTGLWQISGRNDATYEERVQLDSWYARNWQLWYDIVILLKTIQVVFGKKGAY